MVHNFGTRALSNKPEGSLEPHFPKVHEYSTNSKILNSSPQVGLLTETNPCITLHAYLRLLSTSTRIESRLRVLVLVQ